VLRSASVALDPANPANVAIAVLGGSAQGAVNGTAPSDAQLLFTSTDGQTFTPQPIQAPQGKAARELVLRAIGGSLLLAGLYEDNAGSSVVVWDLGPFPGSAGLANAPVLDQPLRGFASQLSLVESNGAPVLLWQETQGDKPWIRAAWRGQAAWTLLSDEQARPCAETSNAVASDEAVYLACHAGAPIAEKNVTRGTLVVYALTLEDGNLTYRSKLPFPGTPTLAIDDDGRVAVLALTQESPERLRALFTSGLRGQNWSRPLDIGRGLHNTSEAPMAEPRILALTFQPWSGTFHVLYSEKPAQFASTLDPNPPRLTKHLAALDRHGKLLYRQSLHVDQATSRTAEQPTAEGLQTAATGARPELVDGPRDGLIVQGTREFVAYSDAGSLVVGGLVESSTTPPGRATVPVRPSEVPTALSVEPPRPFTTPFLALATGLAGAVVVRVLLGRVFRANSPNPEGES
jgi:hypothetical protein